MKSQIVEWNLKYAYDKWWRLKYSVPFGSQQHLQMNPIDIAFEYEEDRLFKEEFKAKKDPSLQDKYYPGEGSFLMPSKRFIDVVYDPMLDNINTLDDLLSGKSGVRIKLD